MQHLTEETIARCKQQLLDEKANLERRIASLKRAPEFGEHADSIDEATDESEELINQEATADVLESAREAVEAALERMHHGTYGACITCGKLIEGAVLEVAPESSLCKACKEVV
jgi:RNA polymerase-binding transcription factor DksA